MKERDTTTIRIKLIDKRALELVGEWGETHSDIIRKLIDHYNLMGTAEAFCSPDHSAHLT